MRMWQPYLGKQDSIYADFRAKNTTLHRVQCSAEVACPSAGYLVAFRHPDTLMDSFTAFTTQIRRLIPAVKYTKDNAHTTLTVYQKQDLAAFHCEETVLDHLCRAANTLSPLVWRQVEIQLNEWLFNADTIIIAGQPNNTFWDVGQTLQDGGVQHQLELRLPWGAHITAARFLTEATGAPVDALRDLLRTGPHLGGSRPVSIDVGSFACDSSGFHFDVYHRFS